MSFLSSDTMNQSAVFGSRRSAVVVPVIRRVLYVECRKCFCLWERSLSYIQGGLVDADRLNNLCGCISSEAGYRSNYSSEIGPSLIFIS
ncbi:hypothetical protein V6N12_001943 [Hibiscus sabdariffa]|uniref:Uncharacterized protein n=1 Tax=Hibiscus sabdariffa TaxID=183260 RepID=A0ABR2BTM1_9ROSI